MMSLEKVAANRRNAQRSTGPCTPEGKRISRRNALKHGILSREVLLASERAGELASGSDNLRRRWMTRATSEAKDCRTRPRHPPPRGRTSLCREAAVGDDLGARHIRRLVRGEEQRDVRNLPRVCDPAEGNTVFERLPLGRVLQVRGLHRRLDDPRMDDVATHVLARELDGE